MTAIRKVDVTILHFTVSPEVGGIESLIDAQVKALRDLGAKIRLVAGNQAVGQPDFVHVPLVHPADPTIRAALQELGNRAPNLRHPIVQALVRDLLPLCSECKSCWIHNALTVFLNPFLTVALASLLERLSHLSWVAWCSDASATSRYWQGTRTWVPTTWGRTGPQLITISYERRAHISAATGVPETEIRVISPPLDMLAWLNIGAEARMIGNVLALENAEPFVIVPMKLLPHKRADRVIGIASHLAQITGDPRVVITAAPSPHEPHVSQVLAERLRNDAARLNVEGIVHLLPNVLGKAASRRTVHDLMLVSDCMIFPSDEEGFGMPLLEAASLRVPILCSDLPVFREVAGDNAWFFSSSTSDHAIAQRVREIADLPMNQKRREVIRSESRFREQIQGVLEGKYQRYEPNV